MLLTSLLLPWTVFNYSPSHKKWGSKTYSHCKIAYGHCKWLFHNIYIVTIILDYNFSKAKGQRNGLAISRKLDECDHASCVHFLTTTWNIHLQTIFIYLYFNHCENINFTHLLQIIVMSRVLLIYISINLLTTYYKRIGHKAKFINLLRHCLIHKEFFFLATIF